jgi:hypothetical protein
MNVRIIVTDDRLGVAEEMQIDTWRVMKYENLIR